MTFNEELVLNAYCNAYFPMGEGNSDRISWYRPDPRAIIPVDSFHIPHSLLKIINKKNYEVRLDTSFDKVVRLCRQTHSEGIWISDKIIKVYNRIYEMGYAHSLEIYKNNELAGGLYGVSIGGAFFGESMFQTVSNCSKIALCELVYRMRQKKMILLDTQFSTPHLSQFNLKMIPDKEYYEILQKAIRLPVSFL